MALEKAHDSPERPSRSIMLTSAVPAETRFLLFFAMA